MGHLHKKCGSVTFRKQTIASQLRKLLLWNGDTSSKFGNGWVFFFLTCLGLMEMVDYI